MEVSRLPLPNETASLRRHLQPLAWRLRRQAPQALWLNHLRQSTPRVRIAGIREIELGNGVAKDTEVLVSPGVAWEPPPPLPCGQSIMHDVGSLPHVPRFSRGGS
jgi:hypothetical protein